MLMKDKRADDGANISCNMSKFSCLPRLSKFSPFTAEWESYR